VPPLLPSGKDIRRSKKSAVYRRFAATRGARPRGFEPLTFGSVTDARARDLALSSHIYSMKAPKSARNTEMEGVLDAAGDRVDRSAYSRIAFSAPSSPHAAT
jgi:hypothetical protein